MYLKFHRDAKVYLLFTKLFKVNFTLKFSNFRTKKNFFSMIKCAFKNIITRLLKSCYRHICIVVGDEVKKRLGLVRKKSERICNKRRDERVRKHYKKKEQKKHRRRHHYIKDLK